jgi:hypothetical protein
MNIKKFLEELKNFEVTIARIVDGAVIKKDFLSNVYKLYNSKRIDKYLLILLEEIWDYRNQIYSLSLSLNDEVPVSIIHSFVFIRKNLK